MMRRLRQSDADLLREAYNWDVGRPSWYVEADHVFNSGSVDDLVAQLGDPQRAFIGLWDSNEQLTAIILVQHHGSGRYEGHLLAQRGADLQLIAVAIRSLLVDLLQYGLTEACCWVAERNISVKRLCDIVGFQPDGVVMWRGAYRNRAIKWLRYFITREQLTISKAA